MQRRITLLLIAFFLVLAPSLRAASGGPDAYGYTWSDSNEPNGPTYSWFPLSVPGWQQVTGLADDNSAGMYNMGWNFHFYWGDYNTFKLGSNGWVSFQNVSNVAHCFPTIPTSGGAADLYVAPLMSDLTFISAFPSFPNVGEVWYWSNLKDSLFISFINVPWWQSGTPDWYGSNTFQVFLSGRDSSITYRYQTMTAGFQNNTGCTSDIVIGIENQTGGIGLQCFSTETVPANNYAIKFKYPGTVLINVADVSPSWNQNAENGGVFFPTGLIPSLQSNIKNVGNVTLSTNTANTGRLRNLATTIVYSSTFNIASLAAGQDSLVTFTPQAVVNTPGQYYWEVTATNSSDINPANNIRVSEIGMVDLSGAAATLTYCTGGASTGSIGWNGGALDDGVGVYQEPPIYPVSIYSLEYYVASNAGNAMIAAIYDDNGPGGSAGTLLFVDTIPSTSIISGAWNTVNLPSSVTITSGGYYVAWFMGGPNIFIGTETNGPISRRSYEVLGGAWASYRDNTLQEFMIKVNINNFPCAITSNFNYAANATTLQFTNASTGGTSYAWDFGDGNTSTTLSPAHTYATTGTYTVCLISTNACGSDTSCQTINVTCPAPVASFSYTAIGVTANFTNNTAGTTSWQWDFGDGQTSTQQNPTHTYANQGSYTVCLIASGSCGADTTCGVVTVCIQPNASFLNSGNGLHVSFNNITSGATSYTWDFGDGSPVSTLQSPTHTFPAAGFYLVCLYATNNCASDSLCVTIEVCEPAAAAFSFSTNQLAATFTNQTVGTQVTYSWSFGDGNTSTQASPSHTYAANGTYNVCLIASDSCASDTLCQSVTVGTVGIEGGLASGLSVYPNPTQDALTVSFELPQAIDGKLIVMDATGRTVWEMVVSSGSQSVRIDLGNLPKGMYFIRLATDEGNAAMPVILQ